LQCISSDQHESCTNEIMRRNEVCPWNRANPEQTA
jgi:hypothetical protein